MKVRFTNAWIIKAASECHWIKTAIADINFTSIENLQSIAVWKIKNKICTWWNNLTQIKVQCNRSNGLTDDSGNKRKKNRTDTQKNNWNTTTTKSNSAATTKQWTCERKSVYEEYNCQNPLRIKWTIKIY